MYETDDLVITQGYFKLNSCDGKCAAQVHVRNGSDLSYWENEAKRTNHKLEFSYHVQEDYYEGLYGRAHDVYQVVPDLEVCNA